jgi:hypothetical protein
MSQRNEEFMKLYQTYRYEHQAKFYKDRSGEFKAAYSQVLTLTQAIMTLTAAVSAATAISAAVAGGASAFWTPILAILAVALPALSTALSAYNELLSFERQSKLYEDTEKALLTASAEWPDHKQGLSENEYAVAAGVYVNMIEGVFQREQGQWGQLQSQAKTVQLPAALTTHLLEEKTAESGENKETAPAKKTPPPAAGTPGASGDASPGAAAPKGGAEQGATDQTGEV